jgi:hypothetical protein
MFFLLGFSHSKVEVASLNDVRLVYIEFKRHDPQENVENHLAQFNMKIYVHEISSYDEIFKGVKSYEEVQDRFQTFPPDQQTSFINFQRHRWNSLPKILQGEHVVTPFSQEAKSMDSESIRSGKHKFEESPKISEVLTQKLEASLSSPLGPQTKVWLKAFLKQGQTVSPSSPTTPVGTSNTIEQQQYTEIGSPVTSLTPLQSIFRTPHPKIVFVNDLTLISLEEMPHLDLFFSKKSKAIVKRESRQKYGGIVKRQRMVYYGNDRDDAKFAKEVIGLLGAFTSTNQWHVDNLAEQLQHKCLLVEQLQK